MSELSTELMHVEEPESVTSNITVVEPAEENSPAFGEGDDELSSLDSEDQSNPEAGAETRAIEGVRRKAIKGVTRQAIEGPTRPISTFTPHTFLLRESQAVHFYPSAHLFESLDLTVPTPRPLRRGKRFREEENREGAVAVRSQLDYYSDDDESDERKRRVVGNRDLLKIKYLSKVDEVAKLREQVRHYTTKEKAEFSRKHKEEVARLKASVEESEKQRKKIQKRYVEAEELAAGYFLEGTRLKATAENHFARLLENLKTSEEEKEGIKKQFEDYKVQIKTRYRSKLQRQEELANLEIQNLQKVVEKNNQTTVRLDAAYKSAKAEESRWQQEVFNKEGEVNRLAAQIKVLIKTNSDWTEQYKKLQDQLVSGTGGDPDLKAHIQNLTTSYELIKDNLEREGENNSKLLTQLEEAAHVASQLRTDLNKEIAEVASLKNQADIDIREKHRLSTQLNQEIEKEASFRQEISKLQSDIQILQVEKTENLKQLQEAEKKLKEENSSNSNSSNELAKVQLELEKIRKEYKDHSEHQSNQITVAEQEITRLKVELAKRPAVEQRLYWEPDYDDLSDSEMAGRNGDLARIFADHLAQMMSKEDRNAINPYTGRHNDVTIGKWLAQAEAVATLHDWSEEEKLKNFSARLTDMALTWHVSRLREFPGEKFADWKKAIREQFSHPAEIESMKIKFQGMTQKPGQLTQHFIQDIENMYDAIYGRSEHGHKSGSAQSDVREDMLLRVFMQGLLPSIRDSLWNGYLMPNYTWDLATKAAVTVERLQVAKALAEPKTINVVSAEHVALIDQQQKQINEIIQQLKDNNINYVQGSGSGGGHHQQQRGREKGYSDQGRGKGHQFQNRKKESRKDSSQGEKKDKKERPSSYQGDEKGSEGNKSSSQEKKSKKKGECHYCRKVGHYARECRKRIADSSREESQE